jgi:hypothetical protein
MKAWSDAIVGLFCMALVSVCFADQSGPYTYKVAGGRAAITAFDKNYSGPLTITAAHRATGAKEIKIMSNTLYARDVSGV